MRKASKLTYGMYRKGMAISEWVQCGRQEDTVLNAVNLLGALDWVLINKMLLYIVGKPLSVS
jgi:hypothetical protein